MFIWRCARVCLVSVSSQLSLWVVTVKLFHLGGLLLQSVLWEQPSARHLSEEHYTFWCFNPFFPLLPSFSLPQPLNLISHFFPSFLPPFFFAGAVNFQLKRMKLSSHSGGCAKSFDVTAADEFNTKMLLWYIFYERSCRPGRWRCFMNLKTTTTTKQYTMQYRRIRLKVW